MRRNEARSLMPEDQIDGSSMEARIARIESDVAHIRSDVSNLQIDVRDIRKDMKAANDAIAELKGGLHAVRIAIDALSASVDQTITALGASTDARFQALLTSIDAKFDAFGASMDAKINALESKLIRWFVGTAITLVALAFSIAKFVS